MLSIEEEQELEALKQDVDVKRAAKYYRDRQDRARRRLAQYRWLKKLGQRLEQLELEEAKKGEN